MKQRDLYFDNIKGVLILLVVFGHLIEPFFYKSIHIKSIYTFIYAFHMPAFIFLSGLFFKPNLNRTFYFLKLFILFQLIRIGFNYFVFDQNFTIKSLAYPGWTLWYLLSMFSWYIIGYINHKLKVPLWIMFFISLFSGFIPIGGILSFQRTLAYSFIFLLGASIEPKYFKEKIKNINLNNQLIFFVGTTVLIFTYFVSMNLDLPINLFYNSSAFYKMNLSIKTHSYVFIRFLNFSAASILSVCMFYFISDKDSIITKIGKSSLWIYLFHTFFIDIAKIIIKSFL